MAHQMYSSYKNDADALVVSWWREEVIPECYEWNMSEKQKLGQNLTHQ